MAAQSIPLTESFLPDAVVRASKAAATLTLALFATVGLALLMYELIRADEVRVSDPVPGRVVIFLPLIEDEPPPVRQPRAEPPSRPELQPEVPRVPASAEGEAVAIAGTPIAPIATPEIGPGSGYADGDLLPIVAITPEYPERAKRSGAEGFVTLEFTVDRRGQVRDPRVLEAEPRGIFERSALQAIERFRYRPRVVNGKALAVTGVRTRLRFSLDR